LTPGAALARGRSGSRMEVRRRQAKVGEQSDPREMPPGTGGAADVPVSHDPFRGNVEFGAQFADEPGKGLKLTVRGCGVLEVPGIGKGRSTRGGILATGLSWGTEARYPQLVRRPRRESLEDSGAAEGGAVGAQAEVPYHFVRRDGHRTSIIHLSPPDGADEPD